MDKLCYYNMGREVPNNAKRKIEGGRLSGKTDINPMWRIKKLTEMFGPCGVGWYTEITKKWLDPSISTDEIAAFVDINLYVKVEGEWSKPIPGTGGNMFIAIEKGKPHASDECYKMAYTDALSVACKALGIGADVYWEADKTKYSKHDDEPPTPDQEPEEPPARPSDVYNMAGADSADNRTLFVNAINIGNIAADTARRIIDDMYGKDVLINALTKDELKKCILALDELVS